MKTFKIAFVLPNGFELFYAYENGSPYLSKNIGNAYKFNFKCYSTPGLRVNEAKKLKEFFFGALEIVEKVIY